MTMKFVSTTNKVCALLTVLMLFGASAVWAGSMRDATTSPVLTFGPSPILVDDATSTVVRTDTGITLRVSTRDLYPGDAVTLWLVIFNNPTACTNPTPISQCSDADIGNPEVAADVLYTAGNVVGASGISNFAGHRNIGDNSGSIFVPLLPPGVQPVGLINPRGGEIHLIVHSHGPMLSEYMPDMIQTYGGGCVDPGAPFGGLWFPEWGAQGPNVCQSVQFAVHQAP